MKPTKFQIPIAKVANNSVPVATARGKNNKEFEGDYWSKVYGDGLDVDGTFNAKEHIQYIQSLYKLMNLPIQTLADFGFGKAVLLKTAVQKFQPAKIIAVDPSLEMVTALKKQKWTDKKHIQIYHQTLQTFSPEFLEYAPVDLGIFNSVLQYIPDADVEIVLEKLALYSKMLYFNVPTKNDYDRMKKEIYFEDPYAYSRTNSYYRKRISKYFDFVSFNLLQSKMARMKKPFVDELFLF